MQKTDSYNSVNSTLSSPGIKYIDAEIIHKYLQKCGKIIRLEALKEMMNDCGDKLDLDGFNGEAQISFELFYKFMTFLLEEK